MKLMIAIVNDADYDRIAHTLTDEQYRVTCIASTGGLFRRGSTTLLMGLEESRINRAVEIIKKQLPALKARVLRKPIFSYYPSRNIFECDPNDVRKLCHVI